MWCRQCNIETNQDECPRCGGGTEAEVPVQANWCRHCHVPVIQEVNKGGACPLCGGELAYLAQDIRPVFPQERLLVELLLGLAPHELLERSVWCENSRYYIEGKARAISARTFQEADCDALIARLQEHEKDNSSQAFDQLIERFTAANQDRLNHLKDEATGFVRKAAEGFPEENIVISFSGGKDSTVTADIVAKALNNPSLVHIYGDTTLEFPHTTEYARRFREAHPLAIFETARNHEQSFLKVCKDIGPPARMMRWCCSMFKTGPITRVLNGLYRNQQILTFYGIRKSESASRSKYNRMEDSKEAVKIQKQTVASPIFFWKDMDIWLYLLAEKVDFNDAYRLGYDRVGCWCCPNNNQRSQFLSRIHMPKQSVVWRNFLIDFARQVGKKDPEVYVDSGKWKARQGGNGLAAAEDVKIRFTNCTAEEHARSYRLAEPFSQQLLTLLVPFGRLAPELGNRLLQETVILDMRTNVPIISVQPYQAEGYQHAVKVKTMNVADHDGLHRKIAYQIRKFNSCRKCLKCESVCKSGAITISAEEYHIDATKCTHCMTCVNPAVVENGCLMAKYLRTKSVLDEVRPARRNEGSPDEE